MKNANFSDAYRAAEQVSYKCPRCSWVSHNLDDVAHRYCGHCHQFEEVMVLQDMLEKKKANFSDAQWQWSLQNFQTHETWPRGGLVQFVIYKHPKDAPDHWMIRRWEIQPGGKLRDCEAYGFKTLEAARTCIPEWATRFERSLHDDPAIFEVWL